MTQLQNTADQFLTGTGILVQGDPFRGNTTGFNNVPLKDGRVEYFCAVAFPKDQPQATLFNELYAVMGQVAATHKYAASYVASQWVGFHWKLEDGDAPTNINKPGFKGCWVLKFKNGFPPNVFDERGQAVPSPYIDSMGADGKTFSQTQKPGPHPFPCGHYVRVICKVKCNESAPPQSGIYLNFVMIQRVGYGTEIQSGPDYTSLIGAAPVAQLAGMSAMPLGGAAAPGIPATPGVPGMPPVGGAPAAPGLAPPVTPAAPGVPPVAGGVVAPPPGVPGGVATPPPPAAPPVVASPQDRMLTNEATYDAFRAGGWTDEMLIANGKMSAPAPGTLPPPGHTYNQ